MLAFIPKRMTKFHHPKHTRQENTTRLQQITMAQKCLVRTPRCNTSASNKPARCQTHLNLDQTKRGRLLAGSTALINHLNSPRDALVLSNVLSLSYEK